MEKTVYILESYVAGFVCANEFAFRGSRYSDTTAKNMPACRSKAEAILHYDLSGRTEPLYDNTGNPANWSYFTDEIRRMKRIR